LLFGSRRINWNSASYCWIYEEPEEGVTPAKSVPQAAEESDDDVDLFGSDDEEDDEEAERIKAERVAAYNKKKEEKESKKGNVIAKSNIIMDIKPWDDETDMKELENKVRGIEMDGLKWGQSKLVTVAYGLKKLQIGCVIEDDKVSTEVLEEQILEFEDHCQSVDIAAFNKI
jgi:elongation factor 1-beta